MSKIMLMSSKLANLIAAGEVIEKPSSVIKELVENSIDAEAKNIFVSVSKAGRDKMVVKDDGVGMDRADAKNCFLRHASSKVKSEYDLTRIHTLGFRGEAIPSIASVSKIVMTTSDGFIGTKVTSSSDSELKIEEDNLRKGTCFEISDLFYNTPARLKYLKSDQSETYSIIDVMERLALGFPSISFRLVIDNKEIFQTSGRGDLKECIQKIYSNRIASSLYEIKKEEVAYSFSGYISYPEINRSSKREMLIFLNNRSIYSYKLSKAVEEAYRDYLPPLRYPFVAINLEIDPSLVDVNVHPSKKEVRISCEDEIAKALKDEIRLVLSNKKPIYSATSDERSNKVLGLEDLKKKDDEKTIRFDQQILTFNDSYESIDKRVEEDIKENKKDEASYLQKDYYDTIFSDKEYTRKLPSMHPIGQILDSYIICDGDNCFYIIDQHAAAERINFEKTEKLFKEKNSRSIPLIPITLELSTKEMVNLDEKHISLLYSIGIIIEPFGDKTIRVTEIPSFLKSDEIEDILLETIHSCLNDEKVDTITLLRLTIANIACKMSIKANHDMSLLEMEALIGDLARCDNPSNCPHGRPTLIKLSKNDIEKLFRRTGF